MIEELFSYEHLDEDTPGNISFYECILNKDIGPYKAGNEFEAINIRLYKGIIELYNDDNMQNRFSFKLAIDPTPLLGAR